MKIKSYKKWSYACLVVGAVLMYFSNWTWAFPAATWLFSIFSLRFTRTQKTRTGLLVLCSASIIVGVASMWKLLAIEAIPPSFRVVSGLAVGVIFFLPFMADRLLLSKVPGVVATLVFPCSWTALEYLKSLGGGSWGALAYTQYGNLPLMQLVSITGIWGVSFLITWFASITNFAWEQQFAWVKFKKIAILYSLIISFVFLYGYARLATTDEPTDVVCIASVANPRDFVTRFYKPDWTDRKSAYKYMQKDLNYLFDATKSSAHAGAKIVFWQEYAVSVMEENEQEFIERAKKIAREEQIYLALAIGLFPLSYPDQPWQNKLTWIAPNGKIIDSYLKLKPAPPLEPIIPGKGGISILDTAYGRIASVICADLDYPSLIHQAGTHNADVLIIPAQDWAAVDPLHTYMAVFRAIENGLSMVKGTGGGLSLAVDPYGRTIKTSDYFNSNQKQMISCLPLNGVVTIYSRISDTFAWLCILGFSIMSGWGYVIGRRQQ
jgi:apolipoprotein N-acyltransferase